MIFTDAQISEAMRMAAMEMADRMEAALETTFGSSIGSSVCVPVALAARVAGMSPQHARRVLPIITLEGAQDQVQFGDIMEYIKERKSK